ncbi:MAG: S8 family serine peptidase [candidate division Zixibacteria bacterium]|nr:S8 family serine peptidase [candidate division Zixibacteria bacterium]
MAPGVDIWTFDLSGVGGINPDYGDDCGGDLDYACYISGTSYSAPIVAAIAAKLLYIRPDILIGTQNAQPIYDILGNTATDLGDEGWDPMHGWGRVNAANAVFAISRGEVNNDYIVNISDAVVIINYVFIGGPPPIPYLHLGDTNCDGAVNVSDAVWILNYVEASGPPPKICFLNLPE